MVRQEQALVKRLDPAGRPVVASLLTPTHPLALLPPWRLPVERRALDLMDGADILGMDVYPSIGLHVLGRDIYLNWMNWSWDAMALRLQRLAEERGKQAWVMEAQAEPWEPREGDASGAGATPSLDPARAVQVYERLREGGFQAILLWGVEHWYVRRERYDDNTWWEAMAALFVRDVNRSP